ncbi:MAG TPA: c-type cytochrome [Thermoanaerobaculia bacterium]|nr:c-type cytochrome [Thermoanaerobaculia bacterium]
MHRPVKLVALALGIVAVTGTAVLLSTLRYGFSTHDEPTRVEAFAARGIRHWSVPADLRAAKNPIRLTPAVLSDAQAHWADHCASCHGNDGKGKTAIGQHLYPRAPDMTLAETQELSDGELFSAIENGIRLTGMPGWGDGSADSGYGSWALVHLIRRLPHITQQELDEMKLFNPVSPEELKEQEEEKRFLEGAGAPSKPHEGHH